MAIIEAADFAAFLPGVDQAKLAAMIEDALAEALDDAPCLADPNLDTAKKAKAKAILRRAIIRWYDSGSGGVTTRSRTAGDYSQSETIDTTSPRDSAFWPSELERLKALCTDGPGAKRSRHAFNIDLAV